MVNLETDNFCEYVSSLILKEYIAGFDPDWKLTFSDISHSELSEATIYHIAKQVKGGFVSGEIQEDKKQGWWFLKIQNISTMVDGSPDWQFMENYIKSLPYSKSI
ncbi:MAG: hypothetical protein LBB85_03065 [Dysgonamonadaceae bacterium]|jgi:hypothetical protein|nr:hypothetical protein [Dysgonamonadaceae bacterium]